ncbi:MAG: hypothetical protein QHJ34_11325 [bacterium]|nr:hypothetical protein [candidate division KSB1 bacterium]MDH7560803.1 hypothetical protein [bacterium]
MIVYEAKKRNPDLTTFAHRGLQHIEAWHFGYGTNSPERWFIDRLSPRWFAYTPLIELQEPVTRTSQLTFRFRPEDVQRWRDWGMRGGRSWASATGVLRTATIGTTSASSITRLVRAGARWRSWPSSAWTARRARSRWR